MICRLDGDRVSFKVNAFCLEGFDPADYPRRATEGIGMSLVDRDAPAHWPGLRLAD